jgi:7-cyano-7-deazaguanine synthase
MAGSALKPLSVVLLSGGMDSCVTLAQALEDGYDVGALHVNYGQLTQARELQAYTELCDHYGIERRLIVDISHLAQIGGSALTDATLELPDGGVEADRIPISYVPFRNANILAIATSWAEVIGAEALYIGAVEEDSSGYPDCRGEFFQAFEAVITAGTRPETRITVRTPVLHCSKADIVRLGLSLQAPFHLSWSCYRHSDAACGTCDSCRLRLRGFGEAGMVDPIPYRV